MSESRKDAWAPLGRTANTEYFRMKERILVAIPDEGTTDDETTAWENHAFQRDHFASVGAPGIVIIFFDRLGDQTRGARQVYAATATPDWSCGFALVGGTALTRALASFFMGLSKPAVATRMFGDLEAALPWIATTCPGSLD